MSEHVFWVATAFQMTEWDEQWISIKFCLKLEHSPRKLFRWFGRLQLWATGDWQLHHDNASTHDSHLLQSFFLTKHQVARVTQPPYSPDLVPFNFWLFPKLKSPLKGKRFQSINEIQENTTGLMVIGRTVWGLLCRGLRSHYPMYNVSCILFKNCLYCSYYVAGYLLDRSRTYVPKYLQFKWNIYRHYPT